MQLPEHLFIASDGNLYDTRESEWFKRPLRKHYSYAFRAIENVAQLKATLRHGEFAWPGGYRLFFVTADGATLSFDAVRSKFRDVVEAMRHNLRSSGWLIVACDSTEHADEEIYCDETGKLLD